jgi:iron complex outermembrane receptor protein
MRRTGAVFVLWGVAAAASAAAGPQQAYPQSLKSLSLEELMDVNVSTASRITEPRFTAPGAVHVVTRDEIRRSGVRTIAEALRLAPGVEVAQENAFTWDITIRGFNGDLSNKLLVLIDGRSVYSPLFAGVFWDVQDYLIEDIDRIEVVSGPGGTLWGANAVNGIVNIITRRAGESDGGLVYGVAGSHQRMAGGRLAGEFGGGWAGRAYLKAFDRDPTEAADGREREDDWRGLQAGFRTDRDTGEDAFTIQGDAYDAREGAFFNRDFTPGTLPGGPRPVDIDLSGANLLGRWTRRGDCGSEMTLQGYLDHTQRDIPETFGERRDTLDLDFQHYFAAGERQEIVWGAGLRYSSDTLDNSAFAAFMPPDRDDWTFSLFAQDRIELRPDRLFLTAGAKLEHNDYTGVEVQPSVALGALLGERQTLWASVSRAVRIPSRLDADLRLTAPVAVPGLPVPVYVRVDGTEAFDSEEVWAYEAGWRAQLGSSVTVDLSAFHNEYEDLQTQEPLDPFVVPGPPAYLVLPFVLANGKDATSNGATLAATWQPGDAWRLQLSYSWLEIDAKPDPGSLDQGAEQVEGSSPRNQAALRAYVDLSHNLSVYAGLRFVDDLPAQGIPDYVALDANVVWRAGEHLELALTGRNLADPRHAEFGPGEPNYIARSWYAQVTWRY